jgi:hypothetical protein
MANNFLWDQVTNANTRKRECTLILYKRYDLLMKKIASNF